MSVPSNTSELFNPDLTTLMEEVAAALASGLEERVAERAARRAQLASGAIEFLKETAKVRTGGWKVDPVAKGLLERRVEVVGGCSAHDLVHGLNSGAKSYIADLWNTTAAVHGALGDGHIRLLQAAALSLGYESIEGGHERINPGTTTRLMVGVRPLRITCQVPGMPKLRIPAGVLDVVTHVGHGAAMLAPMQGGVYFYVYDVQGQQEAGLWDALFTLVEDHFRLARGTIRATVVIDSLAGALEAEEILYALRHHAAGLSLSPQGFACDYIQLFNSPELPILPDRERIGLDQPFLRNLSLHLIDVAHRRGVHAMGAPAFVLPPEDDEIMKPAYLDMITDKEREAIDGHDGTIVAHPGLVNAAMIEFNKSMPRIHQLDYLPSEHIKPRELAVHPTGELTTEGIQRCIRTVLKAMVEFGDPEGLFAIGGFLHGRTSVRLATLLLWHWTRSPKCFITETGLEIHVDVMKYLIRKEGQKAYSRQDGNRHALAVQAALRLTAAITSPEVPPDLLEPVPALVADH